MATPSRPYCASSDVALLIPHMVPLGDFSGATPISKTSVDSLIDRYSALVDMKFAAAGYKIPWEELPGESWPEHQTLLLKLVTAMGVAGVVAGPISRPAPALGAQRVPSDNPLTTDFKEFLTQIGTDGLGMRAGYRSGSKAEGFVESPIGPQTDHLLGLFDVTKWQTIDEYTDAVEFVRTVYGTRNWPFDSLEAKRKELVGT